MPEMTSETLRQRDALVSALNEVVKVFTSDKRDSFPDLMEKGIAPVAEVVRFHRIALYHFSADGKQLGQKYLWLWGKTAPLDEDLRQFPQEPGILLWLEALRRGECINTPAIQLPPETITFLTSYKIKSILLIPIFLWDEFWGFLSLEDLQNYRRFDEDCLDLLTTFARLCANAFILNQSYRNLSRRKNSADILNKMAILFLSRQTDDFARTMSEGIFLLAGMFKLERFTVWRNNVMEGELHLSQIYRWDKETGGTTPPRPDLADIPYRKLVPSWEALLGSGQFLNGPSKLLPESATLVNYGIVSAFVTPIFINEAFWGFVLFEDRHRERYFAEEDVDIMRSAAFLCANTVIRAEMDNEITLANTRLKTRLEQQEKLWEISRNLVSSGDIGLLLGNTLSKVGEHLKPSRILVLDIDYEQQKVNLAYHWQEQTASEPSLAPGLFDIVKSIFPQNFLPETAAAAISCDDVPVAANPSYRTLASHGVSALVCVPLYVEGVLWGIMSVEQCNDARNWHEDEISFISTVSNAIASFITHVIYDDRLQQALSSMTAANQAKSAFLSNMSHEMRTPLNAIIGMTSIGKNARDMERKNYALNKIGDASAHLLAIINDVLDMSKIEANMLELSPVEYCFDRMLQKVVTVINFLVDEKAQQLTVNVDQNIPRFIIGDDKRLSQVITNLLSNAAKFTPEGGKISLEAVLLNEDEQLCTLSITVTDSGIGISQKQQEKLFRAFSQADSGISREFGGTGLGLAISKRIVELMGGGIWVESELEKGSRFTFTVKAGRGSKNLKALLGPDVNWKTIRILVADDEEAVRLYFRNLFAQIKVNCDVAANGEEAYRMIEARGDYDVYFIDWRMPGMDGLELTRKIKMRIASRPSVVTMISSADWTFIKEEAIKAGVDKYLLKPLFSSAIIDCINECLHVDNYHSRPAYTPDMTGDFAGKRLLLVEDVEINREIVIALLENTGTIIDCAENGLEALQMIEAAPDKYDLVFMDVQMPVMDGLESTRRIRQFLHKLGLALPIVAMTANVFKDDIEQCLMAGMDDHVGKPLDMPEVFGMLRKYLL